MKQLNFRGFWGHLSCLPAGCVAVVATLLLSGCMTVRMVDSEVRAFSTLPVMPAGAVYRFERLPSQQSGGRQGLLEGVAEAALTKAGLRRNDTSARYSVQVTEGLIRENRAPYNDPWRRGVWSGSVHVGSGGSGVGLWFPMFPFPEPPLYVREVSLIIRDLASAQAVFETRAVHDGPVAQSDEVLPAMFEAALRDFPNPPQGPRRINIEVPRNP